MRKLFLIVFALFAGTVTYSQGLDLGIKAGANFSSISGYENLSDKSGFHIGVFAGIKFSEKIGVQGDILYSQQGADFEFGEFDLNYINVPVVLKYYLFKGLNVQAGPQFGFVVDDDVYVPNNGGGFSKEKVEQSDVSGVIGAGYDLPLGLRIDARYNFGFKDVLEDTKSKNNVFSLAVGYSFL